MSFSQEFGLVAHVDNGEGDTAARENALNWEVEPGFIAREGIRLDPEMKLDDKVITALLYLRSTLARLPD